MSTDQIIALTTIFKHIANLDDAGLARFMDADHFQHQMRLASLGGGELDCSWREEITRFGKLADRNVSQLEVRWNGMKSSACGVANEGLRGSLIGRSTSSAGRTGSQLGSSIL
jgi:hypothetical protein